MCDLAGVWRLASWSAVWAYEFDGSADDFLYQDPAAPLPRTDDAGPVGGSTLTIGPGGEFMQAGACDAPILTYDGDGLQAPGVAPFGGSIRLDGGRGYLLRGGRPGWATPA